MRLDPLWVALSTYSAIPVPQVPWTEKSTRHALCFFPAVGLLCGGGLWLWIWLCGRLGAESFFFAAGGAALPLLITGGIHMDGYMDTVDALASHQSKARKLEILKDPHCGAFAVIYFALWLLVHLGLLQALYRAGALLPLCPGFVLSRALSGLCALNLPNARKAGMLAAVTAHAGRREGNLVLGLTGLLALAAMVLLAPAAGSLAGGLALAWVFAYRKLTAKAFGGVTGDTAGFFLQMCELLLALGLWMGGLLV